MTEFGSTGKSSPGRVLVGPLQPHSPRIPSAERKPWLALGAEYEVRQPPGKTAIASSFGRGERGNVHVMEPHAPLPSLWTRDAPVSYLTTVTTLRPADSRMPSAPSTKFSASPRFNRFDTSAWAGADAPGPKYDHEAPAPATSPRPPGVVIGTTSPRMAAAGAPTLGPGAYEATSAVGRQVSGRRPNAKRPILGTTGREDMAKVYYKGLTEKDKYGVNSPGPQGYYPRTAMGVDPERRTSPRVSFGDRPVRPEDSGAWRRKAAEPGPGAFELGGGLGKQVESVRPSAASPRFGTEVRMKDVDRSVPGPGTYRSTLATGPQIQSKKASAPSHTFGLATRGDESKLFKPHARFA